MSGVLYSIFDVLNTFGKFGRRGTFWRGFNIMDIVMGVLERSLAFSMSQHPAFWRRKLAVFLLAFEGLECVTFCILEEKVWPLETQSY